MRTKSLLLGAAILIASGGISLAADDTAPSSPAGIAVSKAGTEIKKAVGAGDTLTNTDLNSAIALNKVQNPKDTLATAKVDDPSGNIIGPVKSVMTSKTGMPTVINVDVGGWLGVGERVVSLNAKNFTYLPDRNILVTKLSKDQVKAMKPLKPTG